jgi:serine O-acetyltransferase
MQLSLSRELLGRYISSQLNNFFPDENYVDFAEFGRELDIAIDRVDYCFKHVSHERYNKDGQTILNHLYGDQYLVFLWFLSNTLWKERGHGILANKLYYLNRILHGFDCMYDTAMPDIFLIFHGTGTMLGKAEYKDYFVAFQGCTVGAHKGKYAVFGKGVTLTAHSSVIGNCKIGDRASISSHTTIFEKDITMDTIVYTDAMTGAIIQKPSKSTFAQQFFNIKF